MLWVEGSILKKTVLAAHNIGTSFINRRLLSLVESVFDVVDWLAGEVKPVWRDPLVCRSGIL